MSQMKTMILVLKDRGIIIFILIIGNKIEILKVSLHLKGLILIIIWEFTEAGCSTIVTHSLEAEDLMNMLILKTITTIILSRTSEILHTSIKESKLSYQT